MSTHCHPDEWAARVQLAACYRIFAMLGWTEMIYNHITVRVPTTASGDEKQFLINPFGLHYSEVTASNLVKINLKGEVLDGSKHRINPAGFVVHATLHDGIESAHCVMHTHTTAGVAVACLQNGLMQTNFYSAQLHNMVAYHDFEGITIHADEGPRVLKSIGKKQAVIFATMVYWHGVVQCPRPLLFCGRYNALAKYNSPPSAWVLPSTCLKILPHGAPATLCSLTLTMAAQAKTCLTRWCAKSTSWMRVIANDVF